MVWKCKSMRWNQSFGNLSLRITVPRVSKLRFMWQPSFNLAPADNAWDARSLPARSTKFCWQKQINLLQLSLPFVKKVSSGDNPYKIIHFLNWQIEKRKEKNIKNNGVYTTLAARVLELSFPKNSRAELSIVCKDPSVNGIWYQKFFSITIIKSLSEATYKSKEGAPIWEFDEIWSLLHSKRSPLPVFELQVCNAHG